MYAFKRFLFGGATSRPQPPTETTPQLSVSSTIASLRDSKNDPLSTVRASDTAWPIAGTSPSLPP